MHDAYVIHRGNLCNSAQIEATRENTQVTVITRWKVHRCGMCKFLLDNGVNIVSSSAFFAVIFAVI
jgi:hypothetical protein